jgi:hypothetical protein
MKKTILMLALICFAVIGVSAQDLEQDTNRPNPKAKKDPKPTKYAAEDRNEAVVRKYEIVVENDDVKIYSYAVSKNQKAYIAIDKKTCMPKEVTMEVKDGKAADNQRLANNGNICQVYVNEVLYKYNCPQ